MNDSKELNIYDKQEKSFNSFFIKAQRYIIKENEIEINSCHNDAAKLKFLKDLWRKNFYCELILDNENSKLLFFKEEQKSLFLLKWSY